jgi:hypothetical protein
LTSQFEASGSTATPCATVATATTVSDIPLAYTLSVSRPGFSKVQAIGANDAVTFTRIASGDYTVTLSGVATNCTLNGASRRTITVPADGAAVAGTATFSDLSIDQPGTGYTLVVTSPGLTGAESCPFNVLVPNVPTSLPLR